ncbi:MAG TPA: Fic family protein [Acidimicrobiales bacterium]|nr:Fic family protein [Acidimicrobiales bacterium]
MNTAREPKGVPVGGRVKSRGNAESNVVLPSDLIDDEAWPRIEFEERRFDEEINHGSRRQRQTARGPYRAAVVPEIAVIASIKVPSDVATLAAEASTEIARFDAEIGSGLSNFSAILLRSESASSSEIENLTAGAKAVALAEIGDTSKKNATMIAANTLAMNRAIELADRLDGESIIAMHTALLQDSHPEWTGHWRSDQVRIGGFSVHTAKFVPPHHDRVPAAMADLVSFMKRQDIPTFDQAAVAHAQFETIHPFPDGNGRVGRALIHAILKNRGLTHNVTVPVSAGLLADTDSYFDALTQYRMGDPVPIIGLMAEASFSAIENGRHLAGDLRNVNDDWHQKLKARSDAAVWRVADLVLRQPAIDSALVQRELSLSQPTTDRAIAQLVDAGIVTRASSNRRYQRWVATDVIDALDAFAQRAGRRSKV